MYINLNFYFFSTVNNAIIESKNSALEAEIARMDSETNTIMEEYIALERTMVGGDDKWIYFCLTLWCIMRLPFSLHLTPWKAERKIMRVMYLSSKLWSLNLIHIKLVRHYHRFVSYYFSALNRKTLEMKADLAQKNTNLSEAIARKVRYNRRTISIELY